MALSSIAEQYFSTLNPLAEKIRADVDEAKAAYEAVWESLTDREKTEVINDSLIKPELSLKYTALDTLDFDINDPPFFRKNDMMSFFGREHGRRVVHDEQATYRDEHSAPFLYQTKSQLNLCELIDTRYKEDEKPTAPMVFSELALSHSKVVSELKNALKSHDALKKDSPAKEAVPSPGGGFIAKIMNKKNKGRGEEHERLVSPERTPAIVTTENRNVVKTSAVLHTSKTDTDECEESRGLLASRDSSVSGLGSSHTLTEDSSGVPKTGYDFLDNW